MKSPFPGMDPHLERHWRDVHTTLVTLSRAALNKTLPKDLVARSEERVYVETDGALTRVIAPDVHVVEGFSPSTALSDSPAGGIAVAEPVLLQLETEPVTERFIQIMELDGGRVVTAIEFVSPANKVSADGRNAYLKKRSEFLASDTNLVEIDLVRAGEWVTLLQPYHVPVPYRTTYRVSVHRFTRSEKAMLYPITLRQRLPVISIPLREKDPNVTIDLQSLVDQTYETGRYDTIDYRRPCVPPLDEPDASWADELLKVAGRR